MKKKWLLAFVIVMIGVLFSACGKNDKSDKSLSKVKDKGTLVVATSGTLYPASYYNDQNKLVGYDVDVAREVAKRLGVGIKFKKYSVDGQSTSLVRGETDFAANDFNLSKARAKKFSLSSPIKYSFGSMIVRKSDNSGISSLDDLAGKKAAGEPNTSYMKLAKKRGAKLVTYDNATNDQYLTDVANKRTDVILNDYYLQKMSVENLPDIPVKILKGVYFNPTKSGFLFVKDHNELRKKVNVILAKMKKDGTLKKISQKYFQDNVSNKPSKKFHEIQGNS